MNLVVAAAVLILFVLAGAQCGHALFEAGLLPDVISGWRNHGERVRAEKELTARIAANSGPQQEHDPPDTPWPIYLFSVLVGLGVLGVAINDRGLRARSPRSSRRKEPDVDDHVT